MRVDLRKSLQRELFRLFIKSNLTAEEVYDFVKNNDYIDCYNFLNINYSLYKFIRSLNYSTFMSFYRKFLLNKYKYFKRSKYIRNFIKEVRG